MRVAMYLRVSTKEQTTENQRRELESAVAAKGWQVVQVFEDAGISGSKGRDQRPAFDGLIRGATRGEFDMVAAWSVDRLGRSLQDLIGFLGELHANKVGLYLHQQALDTSTPTGLAMFQMMGVFAQFERTIIVERVKAGVARAQAQGKHCGRPRISDSIRARIVADVAAGKAPRDVAARYGRSLSSVHKLTRAAQ